MKLVAAVGLTFGLLSLGVTGVVAQGETRQPETAGNAPASAQQGDRPGGLVTARRSKDKAKHAKHKGRLPKPHVKDDPQHRCLAPEGIC